MQINIKHLQLFWQNTLAVWERVRRFGRCFCGLCPPFFRSFGARLRKMGWKRREISRKSPQKHNFLPQKRLKNNGLLWGKHPYFYGKTSELSVGEVRCFAFSGGKPAENLRSGCAIFPTCLPPVAFRSPSQSLSEASETVNEC